MKESVRRALRRIPIVLFATIFGVVGLSGPAMAATNLSWSSFPAVSSEDRIEVSETSGAASDSIRVCLESAGSVTWWKVLKFLDWSGGNLGEVFTENGNHGPNCMERKISDIRQLEFWKAKFGGIRVHMYTLSQGELSLKAGKQVTFRWVMD